MSDGGGLFYGGLPPREDTAPVRRRRPWSLPKLALVFGGVALAGIIAVAAVGTVISGSSEEPPRPAPEQPMSPAELEQAEAAIASGGGAAPGHIVSAELCDAVTSYMALEDPAGVDERKLRKRLKQLAAVDSPNQAEYKAFYAMTREPSSVTDVVEAQRVTTDFTLAIQVDLSVCG